MRTPNNEDGRATRYAIGLDIGGTKISGGVVDQDGRLHHRLRVATPSGADTEATLAALLDLVGRLRQRCPRVASLGVGAAGMIEWPRGRVITAPNNAYRDLPLRDLLTRHTGLPTVVENDANAAAWAETRLGRAAGHSTVVVVTVGTGVGGGLVLNGELFRGHSGIGAEVGHLAVNPDGGVRCGCGSVGCLEVHASGTALARMARDAATADPRGRIASLATHIDRVNGETVFAAAQQGDTTARALFARLGHWLGVGLASLANVVDPEVIVVGGGLVTASDHLLPATLDSFARHVFAGSLRRLPAVVPAQLGTEAGLVGAALLALDGRPSLAA